MKIIWLDEYMNILHKDVVSICCLLLEIIHVALENKCIIYKEHIYDLRNRDSNVQISFRSMEMA